MPDRKRFVTGNLLRALLERGTSFTRLRSDAERDFRELLSLTRAARRLRIQRARSRFRSPILVDLLADASLRKAGTDPFEAQSLAENAHEVALRLQHTKISSSWATTCLARANALRGNALRAQGNYTQAAPLLEFGLQLFLGDGDGDPLILGELLSLQASLHHDQGRLDSARELLDRALHLYREVEEDKEVAITLIKQARVSAHAGNPQEAISLTREASGLLDPERDTRLFLSAQHNLCVYLEDLGRFEEARDRMLANSRYYETLGDNLLHLRYAWNLGTIARGLGQLDAAAQTLESVRASFQRHALPYDAALAGLDLALVYLRQGKTDQLQTLAQEIVPIFLAQDIHREAITAILLFQESARRELATTAMVDDLLHQLRQVRRPPLPAQHT